MPFPLSQSVSKDITIGTSTRTFTKSNSMLFYRDETVAVPDSVTLQASTTMNGPYGRSFRLKYNSTDVTAKTVTSNELRNYVDIVVLVKTQNMVGTFGTPVREAFNEVSSLVNSTTFLTNLVSGFM